MEQYKIKVNNEDESEEAQELFKELNGCIDSNDRFGIVCLLDGRIYTDRAEFFEAYDDCKEITLPQLQDLVAQSKNQKGLISGADALRALADGKEVQCTITGKNDWTKDIYGIQPYYFLGGGVGQFQFRLKPRTITLNVEIPACGKNYKHGQLIWILNSLEPKEYCSVILDESDEVPAYWWEAEEEVQAVVAALRGALNAKL